MYYTHPKNLGPALKVDIIVGKKGIERTHLAMDDKPGLKWKISGETFCKQQIDEWLLLYADKKVLPTKLPPLIFPRTTLFTERVWRKMAEIPFGTTISYGELALLIGHPLAYRAVGSACRKNALLLFIPCHRVISSGGFLGEYAGGEEIKRNLNSFENQL